MTFPLILMQHLTLFESCIVLAVVVRMFCAHLNVLCTPECSVHT